MHDVNNTIGICHAWPTLDVGLVIESSKSDSRQRSILGSNRLRMKYPGPDLGLWKESLPLIYDRSSYLYTKVPSLLHSSNFLFIPPIWNSIDTTIVIYLRKKANTFGVPSIEIDTTGYYITFPETDTGYSFKCEPERQSKLRLIIVLKEPVNNFDPFSRHACSTISYFLEKDNSIAKSSLQRSFRAYPHKSWDFGGSLHRGRFCHVGRQQYQSLEGVLIYVLD